MEMDSTVKVRKYQEKDLPSFVEIWNAVVRTADAFPQKVELRELESSTFFSSQSYTAVATRGSEIVGLYILHPNNIGRCSHIANASYAVKENHRGEGIGKALVTDCLVQAKSLGFRILQFNAVLTTNVVALKLYHSLGFEDLGVVKGGYVKADGTFCDIQQMVKYF
ncbi:N-acetyltransferase [uncultured Sphaerochaeta sp.]|uniref:GNAT family N-acetyltransferase n=1 Tax=uncultured Sphaerochaeta sp. TaxID=886478 RepID=UPI002A0A4FB7|nr:N-acetyltransferase [uncultured Sphaerochaeta sp.]